ncbi:GntR family transcriptional regulator [Paludibacterium yongneupense]|uniref:GntR family transcriptional regulator n=1 Tax=Paludibacterium yongneupense TaxID=400061 RepID=UPI0003F4ACA1|nr:GntR family transcriptional regulator [Paludibacterium yongneupense]
MKKSELPAGLATAFDPQALQPVNQQVYLVLRRAIVRCVLLPGILLSEKDVSSLFGVSRQPVREALIKLGEAGLVRVLPQRGSYVSKVSLRQIREGRFIRDAVETAIVRKAAELVQPRQMAALELNIQQQERAVAQRDFAGFLDLDDVFHATLAAAVDCPRAWQFLENIKSHMDRVRYLTLGDISSLDVLLRQHAGVLAALRLRDAEAAAAAMHVHLRELQTTLEQVSRLHPDWFEL